MTKNEIKLAPIGLRVRIIGVLYRDSWTVPGRRTWANNEPFYAPGADKPNTKPGYLVGFAYLKNGEFVWLDDDHCEWVPDNGTIFAARVKFQPRGCEHYARPEDIEIADCEKPRLEKGKRALYNAAKRNASSAGIFRSLARDYCEKYDEITLRHTALGVALVELIRQVEYKIDGLEYVDGLGQLLTDLDAYVKARALVCVPEDNPGGSQCG